MLVKTSEVAANWQFSAVGTPAVPRVPLLRRHGLANDLATRVLDEGLRPRRSVLPPRQSDAVLEAIVHDWVKDVVAVRRHEPAICKLGDDRHCPGSAPLC